MPLARAIRALLACLALAAPAPALAQAASDSADAQAAILESGSMARLADMDFGLIAQPAVAGRVTMTADVAAICSPSPGIVHTGACQPARFAVMGKKRQRVRIRENNGGAILLTGPGGATMTVTNLAVGITDMTEVGGGGGWNLGRYEIDSDSGIGEFRIGGRLDIDANQAAGAYIGTLTIDAHFQ